jgi:hypothetical protein
MFDTVNARITYTLALVLVSACGSDCPSEVDDLLAEVGLSTPARRNCGSFNSASVSEIQASLSCLRGENGPPTTNTELTVTRCADCLIQSTYIATASGDLYHVAREDDAFGDDTRTASVERCHAIVADATNAVSCVEPTRVFACEAKR